MTSLMKLPYLALGLAALLAFISIQATLALNDDQSSSSLTTHNRLGSISQRRALAPPAQTMARFINFRDQYGDHHGATGSAARSIGAHKYQASMMRSMARSAKIPSKRRSRSRSFRQRHQKAAQNSASRSFRYKRESSGALSMEMDTQTANRQRRQTDETNDEGSNDESQQEAPQQQASLEEETSAETDSNDGDSSTQEASQSTSDNNTESSAQEEDSTPRESSPEDGNTEEAVSVDGASGSQSEEASSAAAPASSGQDSSTAVAASAAEATIGETSGDGGEDSSAEEASSAAVASSNGEASAASAAETTSSSGEESSSGASADSEASTASTTGGSTEAAASSAATSSDDTASSPREGSTSAAAASSTATTSGSNEQASSAAASSAKSGSSETTSVAAAAGSSSEGPTESTQGTSSATTASSSEGSSAATGSTAATTSSGESSEVGSTSSTALSATTESSGGASTTGAAKSTTSGSGKVDRKVVEGATKSKLVDKLVGAASSVASKTVAKVEAIKSTVDKPKEVKRKKTKKPARKAYNEYGDWSSSQESYDPEEGEETASLLRKYVKKLEKYRNELGFSPRIKAQKAVGPVESVDSLDEIEKRLGNKKAIVYGQGEGTAFLKPEIGYSNTLPQESSLSDFERPLTTARGDSQATSFEQIAQAIADAGFKGLDKIFSPITKAGGSLVDKLIKGVNEKFIKDKEDNGDDYKESLGRHADRYAKTTTVEKVEDKKEEDNKEEEDKLEKPEAKSYPVFESPAISKLPEECLLKFNKLRKHLRKLSEIVERLTINLLANKDISYMTSNVLSQRLMVIKMAVDEARMAGNVGNLRALATSAKEAGLELTRFANNRVSQKLDPNLKIFVRELRAIFVTFRKSCSVSSSAPQ